MPAIRAFTASIIRSPRRIIARGESFVVQKKTIYPVISANRQKAEVTISS